MRAGIRRELLRRVEEEDLLDAYFEMVENAMGTSSGQRKDFEDMMAEARRQGFVLTQSGGTHWRAKPPDPSKTIVYFAISGEPRAFKNTVADMRKRGLVWPPPAKKKPEHSEDAEVYDLSITSDQQLQETLAAAEADELALEEQAAAHYVATNGVTLEEAIKNSQPPSEPAESPEERVERLFAELRDAKTYLALVDADLANMETKLAAATRERDGMREERRVAAEKLRSLKSEFDREFAGEVAREAT